MLFYLIFFIIIIFLSINYPLKIKINNLSNKSLINYHPMPITFLFISIVLGLRYNVGTDYLNYVQIFENYKSMVNPPNLEFGYDLINRITIYLGIEFWFVFLVSALLINFLVLKTFKENSGNFLLSVIILFGTGFIFFQTNGIRQALAISFTFYGSKYIVSRNFKKYIIFCILGMMFHFTAFIMIPFYWIANIKWPKKILLFGLFLSLILFLQPNRLTIIINKLLDIFTIPRYSNYYRYIQKGLRESLSTNTGYRVILEGILAFLFVLLSPKKINKYRQGRIYFNFFALSYISNMFLGRVYALSRITLYFSIFQTLFLPYFVFNISLNKKSKVLLMVLIILYYSFWTVWLIQMNSHHILPYKFVFNR